MNRRSFLAGLGAGIAALALTTKLAQAQLRPVTGWDMEGDFAMLWVGGIDHAGDRMDQTVIITAQQLAEGDGSVELPQFKIIDSIYCDNHDDLAMPGRFVCGVHGTDQLSMNHPRRVYWSSALDPTSWS